MHFQQSCLKVNRCVWNKVHCINIFPGEFLVSQTFHVVSLNCIDNIPLSHLNYGKSYNNPSSQLFKGSWYKGSGVVIHLIRDVASQENSRAVKSGGLGGHTVGPAWSVHALGIICGVSHFCVSLGTYKFSVHFALMCNMVSSVAYRSLLPHSELTVQNVT